MDESDSNPSNSHQHLLHVLRNPSEDSSFQGFQRFVEDRAQVGRVVISKQRNDAVWDDGYRRRILVGSDTNGSIYLAYGLGVYGLRYSDGSRDSYSQVSTIT